MTLIRKQLEKERELRIQIEKELVDVKKQN